MFCAVRNTLFILIASAVVGCSSSPALVPIAELHRSQRYAKKLYSNSKSLTAERDEARQMAMGLEQQSQELAMQRDALLQNTAALENSLTMANQRVDSMRAAQSKMRSQFISALDQQKGPQMSDQLRQRFQDLANRFPDFDFDPVTGVSRFREEILFPSGSDKLRSKATPVLQEFAQILSEGEAESLRVLVVGHTDDKRIVQRSTHNQHPTNWHLSTDRANAVLLALKKFGIREDRMGAMGYSKHQPVVPNVDETARQQNRRVEIYVLAPGTEAIASNWDPLQVQ